YFPGRDCFLVRREGGPGSTHLGAGLPRSTTNSARDRSRERSSSCFLEFAMPSSLQATARRILVERFGHREFQKGQWEPIRAVLEGRDALVVMPTGSGKSLIYQLPALMLPGLTIVVSPLIALMKDQQDKLAACGVDALAMHSHLSDSQARDLADRVESGSG